MSVIALQVFVSLMLVAGALVLFVHSVRQRDLEHADRLALQPLADDVGPPPRATASAPPPPGVASSPTAPQRPTPTATSSPSAPPKPTPTAKPAPTPSEESPCPSSASSTTTQ